MVVAKGKLKHIFKKVLNISTAPLFYLVLTRFVSQKENTTNMPCMIKYFYWRHVKINVNCRSLTK